MATGAWFRPVTCEDIWDLELPNFWILFVYVLKLQGRLTMDMETKGPTNLESTGYERVVEFFSLALFFFSPRGVVCVCVCCALVFGRGHRLFVVRFSLNSTNGSSFGYLAIMLFCPCTIADRVW